MKKFNYRRAAGIDDVISEARGGATILAGGTDLLTLMKENLRAPETLVDIKRAGLPGTIDDADDEVTLGALVTIADIEHNAMLQREFTLLAEAAAMTATPQLRNRATLAGNVLQASRCWYYRHPDLRCWLAGGEECYAREGCSSRHGIIDRGPCISVHPSDLAGCLVALDATVTLQTADGESAKLLSELLTIPDESHRELHALAGDAVITRISLPAVRRGLRSTYLKSMSRKAWSFALVGVAVALDVEDGQVVDASVVVNGVAPTPWRLTAPVRRSSPLKPAELVAALSAELESLATPRDDNAYKLSLGRALLGQAVERLTADV